MLQLFSVNVYELLDTGATLYFVTTLVSGNFDVLPDVLIEPFQVCTLIVVSVVAKRVYSECFVMLPNRVILVDMVELDMFDFDICKTPKMSQGVQILTCFL